MVNDRDARAVEQSDTLRVWCKNEDQLQGHLLFATSGSTGEGKWVALSRSAILASAKAVNAHLGVEVSDHWLLALPVFHVGGMGMLARSYEASCSLTHYDQVWNAPRFHEILEKEGITLTSLVPTQLVDLVSADLCAPQQLRAVLLGGGAIDDSLYQKAIERGWPIIETYGMTEASSQIATATVKGRQLQILPCWECKTDADGTLSIKGKPLMSSYVRVSDRSVTMESSVVDGWFATNDRVLVESHSLQFLGRSDRCVKVLGELVDLTIVEKEIQLLLEEKGEHGSQIAVVALPDGRKAHRLVLCAEYCFQKNLIHQVVDAYNLTCNPVNRIGQCILLEKLPRSPLGKILYAELENHVVNDCE